MPTARRTIDDLLTEARARLRRLSPQEAFAASERGAKLIDVRTAADRARDGGIPGALVIELIDLEWRVDPDSGATHPQLGDLDTELILFCKDGYASSLAAARLQDLGARRATDIDGGFNAWRRAGLPATPDRSPWP